MAKDKGNKQELHSSINLEAEIKAYQRSGVEFLLLRKKIKKSKTSVLEQMGTEVRGPGFKSQL